MGFINSHLGEFAALLTAIFWTITALAFESASKRIGSVAVNILRLFIGLIFLTVFNLVRRGIAFPVDASSESWFWLIISGLVGFVFGDLFLFKSYTIIGSRFAMLIQTLVPPITAFFSWIILDEHLRPMHFLGMSLTFAGIVLAIFNRSGSDEKFSLKLAPAGILFAFGGAVGQALGLIFSKIGVKDYDPFAATQIRILAGIIGFSILVTILRRWKKVVSSVRDFKGMKILTIGSFFGPFMGVSFSLIAVKRTEAGIAATIMALVPVFIILPSILLYKEKVTPAEIAGAILSVTGVALFFL